MPQAEAKAHLIHKIDTYIQARWGPSTAVLRASFHNVFDGACEVRAWQAKTALYRN